MYSQVFGRNFWILKGKTWKQHVWFRKVHRGIHSMVQNLAEWLTTSVWMLATHRRESTRRRSSGLGWRHIDPASGVGLATLQQSRLQPASGFLEANLIAVGEKLYILRCGTWPRTKILRSLTILGLMELVIYVCHLEVLCGWKSVLQTAWRLL